MMICVRGSCKTDNLVFFCLVPDMIPGQICIRKSLLQNLWIGVFFEKFPTSAHPIRAI